MRGQRIRNAVSLVFAALENPRAMAEQEQRPGTKGRGLRYQQGSWSHACNYRIKDALEAGSEKLNK